MNLKFLMQNFAQFIKADDRDYMYNEIYKIFIHDQEKEDLLVTLSIRTAFDAFLQEMNYPQGTEIIVIQEISLNLNFLVQCNQYSLNGQNH